MRLTLLSAALPLRRVGKGARAAASQHEIISIARRAHASTLRRGNAWARREDAPLPTLLTFKEAA